MRRESILAFILLTCALATVAGAAAVDLSVVWNKTYGKPGANDSAYSIIQIPGDRGYVFSGETESFGAGEADAWVVDLSRSGDERWNRTYGDRGMDTARSVINTSDGNYLFVGAFTYIMGEDRKDTDVLVVKFSPTGDIIWNETFGGPEDNATAYAVAETADGGYIVVGKTAFWGEPDTDALVIKLNRSGSEEWSRTFGEPGLNDTAYAVVAAPSGDIGITGSTESFGAFAADAFVQKIDSSGNETWNVTFGGAENDTARSIVLAPDGGFVFAGSYMSRTASGRTDDDALVARMRPDGKVAWNWTYGNADENESAESIIATRDGGYLFAGRTGESPLDNDAWIVKLDGEGAVEGDLTIGGRNPGDRAASVIQTTASEYVFAGTFNSTKKGGTPDTDAWVVKLAAKPKTIIKPPAKPPKPPNVCPGQCPPPTPKPPVTQKPQTGSIGDLVWNDTNKNGIQDKGENGSKGGGVELLGSDGKTVVKQTKTDSRGTYLFSGLQPGEYYVEFSLPKDYTFTRKDAGDDAKDSDADPATGRTAKITLKAGEKQLQWDAGLVRGAAPGTGQIGDFVWEDKNGNGLQDGDEAGLKDVTVKLLDGTGKPIDDAAGKPREVKTDGNGKYLFDNLVAGDYIVEFGLPKDYTFTRKDAGDDAKDSDADPTTGRTAKITLKAGEKQLQWDAGLVRGAGQIAVVKKTNGQAAKNPPGPTIKVGDKVTWTYEVTNPGSGPLANVKVTDDKAGPIAGPPAGDANGDGKLDPGETWVYTKDDTAKDTSGMPGGSYKNTVTVTADDQTAKPVTATDLSHYTSSTAGGGCACTADFTFSTTNRAPPAGVQNPDPLSLRVYHFQGSVQTTGCPAGVAPTTWEWDFGDGKGWQDLGQNPTHTFAAAKTYDVKLRVTLSNGVTCEIVKKVTVEAPPQPEGKGSIGDFVWNDRNQNGKQDSGEKGLAGVSVALLDENDNPINGENGQPRRVTTKEDGKYVFDNLVEGKYRVRFDPPQGNWIHSPMDNVQNDDDLDSDPGISGRTGIIVIKEGALVQLNWDAGFYNHAMQGTGQIGDLVWEDENENGIQDGGEKGVPGVSVNLMDDQFMHIYTTATDANGKYLFTDLTAGDYYVVFGHKAAQREAKFTKQDVDANTKDDVDSDASMIGRTDKITLQDNQKQLNWDAGLIFLPQTTISPPPQGQGSIVGVTFNDQNGNGIQDGGESGVPGVGVTLLAGPTPGESTPEAGTRSSASGRETSGITLRDDDRTDRISFAALADAGNLTAVNETTTDENGTYTFTNLTIGEYYLVFDPPEGYAFTIPGEGSEFDPETGTAGPINIVKNDTRITLNIGLNRPPTVVTATANSTIGDLVWNDTNGNGIQDRVEGGIAGAAVELYHANETLVNSTTTDADGAYLFSALPAGDYYLIFGLPEGYNFTPADRGTDDARDSDADPATGRTATITLADNDTQLTWDAGANLTAAQTATIGDFVWNDTNGNALQDEGEPGVPGVTVRLLNENGYPVPGAAETVVETTTGADGRYALKGIVGTTYIVEVVAPDGLFFVLMNAGDDTRDSDVGFKTGRTGPFTLVGDDLTQDAGLTKFSPGARYNTIGGFAWNDTNADGARDAGETGVSGVAVTLIGADGTTARTATTDGDGAYRFTDVVMGTYSVSFTLPEGYTFSPAGQDSTVDPGSGTTEQFEIGPNEEQLNWNAGLVPLAAEVTPTPEVTVTPEATVTPEEEATAAPEATTTPEAE